MADLHSLLASLKKVKKTKTGYVACCPAHDDREPSLKVDTTQDGRILVYCHAGCTQEAVVGALGMTLADLMPEADETPAEITYDYHDEGGSLLFQVVRRKGKKFVQRRVVAGGYVYSLDGVRRVLYRLPEIKKAIDRGRLVFVVEGEKDAETLVRHGFAATTNPQGAGKWLEEYTESLRGALVVIVPDNDRPGRRHARAVAEATFGVAASVRVLRLPDLPERGDVSDYMLSHSREQFMALVRSTPVIRSMDETAAVDAEPVVYPDGFTARELLAMTFPPAQWIVDGILPEGSTLLVGKPKTGKSFAALNVAYAVASGGRAFGKVEVEQGRVLYLVLEGTKRNLQARCRSLMALGPAPDGLHFYPTWPKMDEGGLDMLRAWLRERADTRLVIIDTLKMIRPAASPKRGMYDVDYEAVSPLTHLAEDAGAAFLIIHHSRKLPSPDDPFDLASGSTGLMAGVDSGMILRRSAAHTGIDLYVRGREIEDTEVSMSWDARLLTWILEGDAREFSISTERRAIIEAIRDGICSPKEIAEYTQLPYDSVKHLVLRLTTDRMLEKTGRGLYAIAEPLDERGEVVHQPFTFKNGTDDSKNSENTPKVNVVNAVNAPPHSLSKSEPKPWHGGPDDKLPF